MAKLEAAIAARQQEEEEARLKSEQKKERAIRSQQKEKVSVVTPITAKRAFEVSSCSTYSYVLLLVNV